MQRGADTVPAQQVWRRRFSLLPPLVFHPCYPWGWSQLPVGVNPKQNMPPVLSHWCDWRMVVSFCLCLLGHNDCGYSSVSCLGLLVPVHSQNGKESYLLGFLGLGSTERLCLARGPVGFLTLSLCALAGWWGLYCVSIRLCSLWLPWHHRPAVFYLLKLGMLPGGD